MILRIRGYHMHTFTDFSDGALFGPEVRSSLVEKYETELHGSRFRIVRASTWRIFIWWVFRFRCDRVRLNSRQRGIDFLSEDDYVLAHLVRSPGQRIGYLYDFGDYWPHEILVSRHAELCSAI